ncbi:MAG: Ppx/GppA phosphatase family protein [Methylovirgula sp.]
MKQRAGVDAGIGLSRLQGLEIEAIATDGSRAATPASSAARLDSARRRVDGGWRTPHPVPTYAALDLGTNNCRLLIARPAFREPTPCGFKIIDSFSRIVRLGEGLTQTGRLGEAAIERTLEALAVCKDKMHARNVTRARLIATEACRAAENGAEFVARVREGLGLDLEIVDRETEAQLAATGCASLADTSAESVLLFDIGGGSSEVIWLDRGGTQAPAPDNALRERIRLWVSLKLGVVSLAEKFGGIEVTDHVFDSMVDYVTRELEEFTAQAERLGRCGRFHLLGTSGTVTTIAGIFLNLARYDRRRVDGLWMSDEDVGRTVERLRKMSYHERVANGCIGPERADLVLAGCAILEAIRRAFPAERVRIADRGLREGILLQMMQADRAKGWTGPR